MSARRRRGGFTLIEILIATSLLAVLGLAVAETLRAARDADRRLQTRSERRAHDRAVLERIARDIRGIVYTGGQYAAGIVGTNNQRSGGEALSLADEEARAQAAADAIQAPPPPFIERDQLTLSVIPGARRFGSPWPAGTGAIQSIIWAVDDDPATPERGLVRRPTTITDPVTGSLPEPVEIVGANVVGLAFRYFDGQQWQDTWDSGASSLLPQAIEVSVAVRDDDGTIRRLLEVVAPLTGRVANPMTPAASK
jgi:prepilin-type N-terminal cleavage/methylation domain-containing protein